MDLQAKIKEFAEGTCFDAYKFLGCHSENCKTVFRVWAPNAKSVRVVGRFNDWNRDCDLMKSIGYGIWEQYVEDAENYDEYKYYIERSDGSFVMKSDPYGFHMCSPPENASKVYFLEGFQWEDEAFLEEKKGKNPMEQPINVYEVHLGSWKK